MCGKAKYFHSPRSSIPQACPSTSDGVFPFDDCWWFSPCVQLALQHEVLGHWHYRITIIITVLVLTHFCTKVAVQSPYQTSSVVAFFCKNCHYYHILAFSLKCRLAAFHGKEWENGTWSHLSLLSQILTCMIKCLLLAHTELRCAFFKSTPIPKADVAKTTLRTDWGSQSLNYVVLHSVWSHWMKHVNNSVRWHIASARWVQWRQGTHHGKALNIQM